MALSAGRGLGAGIANYMFANILERRREIGTLMAMGAGSRLIQRMFLIKALLLGLDLPP